MEALYIQTLLQSQLEIQARALRFINNEIYDNIGQILSAAKLNLGVLKVGDNNCEEKVVVAKNLIDKAIIDLRNLCEPLDPEKIISVGLAKSIEYELKQLEKTTKFQYQFSNQIESFSLNSYALIILFRMVQQLLEFVMNYATYKQVSVHLFRQKMHNTISIQTKINDINIAYHLINSPIFTHIISKANIIGAQILMEDTENNQEELTIQLILPIQ